MYSAKCWSKPIVQGVSAKTPGDGMGGRARLPAMWPAVAATTVRTNSGVMLLGAKTASGGIGAAARESQKTGREAITVTGTAFGGT